MESTSVPPSGGPRGLHVVAKPAGPACNLACDYCFYREKESLFPPGGRSRMDDRVLSALVSRYVAAQPTPVVEFVWQGGEPTLLGPDFFRRVVALQAPFAGRKTITNSLQTNGVLLTDEWCSFLKEHGFLVGLSLDGPREIHDRYRRDRGGRGSFDGALRGLRLLRKHGVEHNVMACVPRETARHPLEVYRFFRDEGVEFVQFSPVVERLPGTEDRARGLLLASPAPPRPGAAPPAVTPWSVDPEEYGDFLIAVCEEWVRRDVGKLFVMNFEWALAAWMGEEPPVCVHARRCGRSVVVEHDGSVFACDHHVYPEHRLGNVLSADLGGMVEASLRSGFGVSKETSLPRRCRECPVLAACGGGCPKQRFDPPEPGEPPVHYLCDGYRKFFLHVRKYLKAMATLLENGHPASWVMDAVRGPLVVPRKEGSP